MVKRVAKAHRKDSTKNHEDHIAGKELNSLSRYNLMHKFIPILQAMKIPDTKAVFDKEWEVRNIVGMANDESQELGVGGQPSKNSDLEQ